MTEVERILLGGPDPLLLDVIQRAYGTGHGIRLLRDLGMGHATFSQWRNGVSPSVGKLRLVTDYLGLDIKVVER